MRSSLLSNLCIFIGGALVGSSVTYLIVKNKYERLIDEEIESVKETYEEAYGKKIKTATLVDETSDTPNPREKNQRAYEELIKQYGNNKSDEDEDKEEDDEEGDEDEMNDMIEPYVITPDEFGDTDYETVCLTLYADGVITDDFGDMMSDDDIDTLIGRDSLKHMGENAEDPDVLYVRNENEEVDYEIARDVDKYFQDERE